jgi:aspartate/methionine/tyrosine aminotransferase
MICPDPDLIMDAVILRENASEIMNIMGEVIAEVALRPDRLTPALDKARAEGRINLNKMDQWVEAQDHLSWVLPQAGLIGLAKLPYGIDSDAFAKRLLRDPYRTFILPGSAYHEPRHIRLGVGGGAGVNLSQGLDRVAQALADWES